MRRIEGEAARMGVLVEDLLALARMDEVREPVRRPSTSRRSPPTRSTTRGRWRPTARSSSTAPRGAVVAADPLELRQVLGNLLRNALVHTPEGTRVEVAVGREDGEVRVDVRDHGDGLPEGGGEALFERFWRAEGGRTRGKAGAGLGLAIVAAIVRAPPRPRRGRRRRGRRRALHRPAPGLARRWPRTRIGGDGA